MDRRKKGFPRGLLAGQDLSRIGQKNLCLEDFSMEEIRLEFTDMIGQYSSRSLTFERDSLNAFLGIANHLNELKHSILHLWGIPFFPLMQYRSISPALRDLSLGLLWRHDRQSAPPYIKTTRRLAFPSWTWAGWAGAARPRVHGLERAFHSHVLEMHFELDSGEIVELSNFLGMFDLENPINSHPRGLHLTVMVARPELFSPLKTRWTNQDSKHWSFRLWSFGGNDYPEYQIRFPEMMGFENDPKSLCDRIERKEWLLILMGSNELSKPLPFPGSCLKYCLLIVKQEEGFISQLQTLDLEVPINPHNTDAEFQAQTSTFLSTYFHLQLEFGSYKRIGRLVHTHGTHQEYHSLRVQGQYI